MAKSGVSLRSIITNLLLISLPIGIVQCIPSPSRSEGLRLCAEATGLKLQEIEDVLMTRNDNCLIDCFTKQATAMSFYAKTGTECGTKKGYTCQLGFCRGPEEGPVEDNKDLYSLQIRILKAHVPDLDSAPGTGSSDTLVVVHVDEGLPEHLKGSTTICHTYVIQDSSDPQWKNFVCKPVPLKGSAKLRFEVLDSDKPALNPDHIGTAIEQVSNLINRGPVDLKLVNRNKRPDDRYWLKVDIIGKEFGQESTEN